MPSTKVPTFAFFNPASEDPAHVSPSCQYSSILYKITKDEKVSYLYGTYHLPFLETCKLSSETKEAFESSDTLLIETYYQTQDEFNPDQQALEHQIGEWVNKHIASCSLEQLEQLIRLFNKIDPELDLDRDFFTDDPMTALQLFQTYESEALCNLVRNNKLTVENSPKIEASLVHKALEFNMRIDGLEKLEGMKAYFGLNLDIQEQIDLIENFLSKDPEEKLIAYLGALIPAYVSGNLLKVFEISISQFCPDTNLGQKYLHHLVYERDSQMAAKMQTYLTDGGAFIAIGASHLIGVIEKLSIQGFKIEPIQEGERVHVIQSLTNSKMSPGP